MTGLLIAVLAAAQRNAMRVARDWQTRFEAAIGAHRLLAYEWDPVSGQIAVTGDAAALVGVPATGIGTLADWIALAAADDRERVSAPFRGARAGQRRRRCAALSRQRPGGAPMTATDEARAIRDHDGQLHRVVAIVRFAPLAGSRSARVSDTDVVEATEAPAAPAAPAARRLRRHLTACS